MKRGNILVVDDDSGFLTALTKLLVKQGYEVTGTTSPANALVEIQGRKREINLVITDLAMPAISGRTVLNTVKNAYPDMEVIVITAFGDQLAKDNAIRDGAFAFVGKPLDPRYFLDTVERAVEANLCSKENQSRGSQGQN